MNSNAGLWQHSSVEPNVEVVFGDNATFTMNNYLLSFRFARDIKGFEELHGLMLGPTPLKLQKHLPLTGHLNGPAIQRV